MPTDQLHASLAGEDDGGCVVLCRVSRALGGAVVSDGHFACRRIDLRAAGRPSNVLQGQKEETGRRGDEERESLFPT